MPAVRAEDGGDNGSVVLERIADRGEGVGVPDPHGVVVAAGGEAVPVGTVRDTVDHIVVAAQGCPDGLAGVGVPDAYRLVGAAGGEAVPVGTVGDALDMPVVAAQGRARGLSGFGVKDLHRVARLCGGHRDAPAVGTVGDVVHPRVRVDDLDQVPLGLKRAEYRVFDGVIRGEGTGGEDQLHRDIVAGPPHVGQHVQPVCHQLVRERVAAAGVGLEALLVGEHQARHGDQCYHQCHGQHCP